MSLVSEQNSGPYYLILLPQVLVQNIMCYNDIIRIDVIFLIVVLQRVGDNIARVN